MVEGKFLGRLPFRCPGGWRDSGGDDEAVAVLHQQVAHVTELGGLTGCLAIEPVLRGGGDLGGFGRVGEPLIDVPLGERRQSLPQGVDRQRVGVLRQIAGNAVRRGRQIAAPGHLKVLDGALVAAPRVAAATY